jgi:hypothetical protein
VEFRLNPADLERLGAEQPVRLKNTRQLFGTRGSQVWVAFDLGEFFSIYFDTGSSLLELDDPPASASRVLRLQACTTTPHEFYFILLSVSWSPEPPLFLGRKF